MKFKRINIKIFNQDTFLLIPKPSLDEVIVFLTIFIPAVFSILIQEIQRLKIEIGSLKIENAELLSAVHKLANEQGAQAVVEATPDIGYLLMSFISLCMIIYRYQQ